MACCSALIKCGTAFAEPWQKKRRQKACSKYITNIIKWIIGSSPLQKCRFQEASRFSRNYQVILQNKELENRMWGFCSLCMKRFSPRMDRIRPYVWYPSWWGSEDWAPACEPKGHWFNSQSGHMPGLWARSPVGGAREETTHWCFSPSLSPSLSLHWKINI